MSLLINFFFDFPKYLLMLMANLIFKILNQYWESIKPSTEFRYKFQLHLQELDRRRTR